MRTGIKSKPGETEDGGWGRKIYRMQRRSAKLGKCEEAFLLLEQSGFRSWVSATSDSAAWMVKSFGDVYLHETDIAHIWKLLDGKFAHHKLHEPPVHFMERMRQVEDHMDSSDFAAIHGKALMGLAIELRPRCEQLIRRQGESLPK